MHQLHFVALVVTSFFIVALLTTIVLRSTGREYLASLVVTVFSGGYTLLSWGLIAYAKAYPY